MNPTPGPPEIPPGPPSGFPTPPPHGPYAVPSDNPALAPAVSPSAPPYHPAVVPSGYPSVPPAPVGPPVPPRGPGVVPPFAAPPTEGRTMRLWLGLGAAGLFVLLCCGGGVAAIAGLTVFGVRAIDEQARVVVTDYVDALERAEYGEAYALLCDDRQRVQTPTDFARSEAQAPRIQSFQVHATETGATDIVVPVDVTYSSGSSSTLRFLMAQDSGTGEFEVCGVTD